MLGSLIACTILTMGPQVAKGDLISSPKSASMHLVPRKDT